jgi:hypothetical protein
VDRRGRVLLATLENRPHGLMDRGTVAGLAELVRRADADDGVGAVVLTLAAIRRATAHDRSPSRTSGGQGCRTWLSPCSPACSR